MGRRLVRGGASCGLLIVFSVICFVVAEMVIRQFLPQQMVLIDSRIFKPDSELGWRHGENVAVEVNTGERSVNFYTDEDGYRTSSFLGDAQTPGITVLILGDSFLEALQVENEDAIPELLASMILTRHDVVAEFKNAAVSGWDPNQYYLEARSRLRKERFDLGVVFLYVANDIVDAEISSFSPRTPYREKPLSVPSSMSFSDFREAILFPINDLLEARSHVFVLLKSRLEQFSWWIGVSADYMPQIFMKSSEHSERWETTATVCQKIAREFARYDTPTIFVLLPVYYQVHQEVFFDFLELTEVPPGSTDLEQPNRLLQTTFLHNSLRLYDPLPAMREDARLGRQLFGSVDRHLSPRGHEVVAEFLFPILESYAVRSDTQ